MLTTHNDPSALLEQILQDPTKYPEGFLVLRRDSGLLARAFSRESLRILRVLEQEGPIHGISALADRLARDRTRVSKDAHFLEGLGLVWMQRDGRTTRIGATQVPILIQ